MGGLRMSAEYNRFAYLFALDFKALSTTFLPLFITRDI
jgi:hypothetical protein